jgi:glycerol uptake facilitator-like aquaporin
LADRLFGDMDNQTLAGYIAAQVTGGITGVICANLMFDLDAIAWSATDRTGSHRLLAEAVATLGLLLVIHGVVRSGKPTLAAFSVSGYIAGAYWFTSSTSFANPAVTVARMFSDTFAGIAPASAPGFIAAQLVATVLGVALIRYIFPKSS